MKVENKNHLMITVKIKAELKMQPEASILRESVFVALIYQRWLSVVSELKWLLMKIQLFVQLRLSPSQFNVKQLQEGNAF